ncbi:hypothetical protein E27107_390009 [Elizabethkingia anophelis]|nr:hypothetical protein E18064_200081 [Elizabethkingia anophelis]CDN78983.1 hypothetical protein E27107_390009 [Elizabethkingia anophelis]
MPTGNLFYTQKVKFSQSFTRSRGFVIRVIFLFKLEDKLNPYHILGL